MSFKRIRNTTLLLTITAALIALSACSGKNNANSNANASAEAGADKPITITYMTTQARIKEAQKQMAELMKQDENYNVEFQVVPDPQFNSLLLTKIASGEVPDVVDLNTPASYETFNYRDNFEDLSGEPWVARLNNADSFRADGKIYSFPYVAPGNVIGAIYNKQVFADLGLEVPTTYGDFLNVLAKIKESGKDPLYLSNKDTWTTQIPMLVYTNALLGDRAQQNWEELVQNKKKFADIPEFKQALGDYRALVTDGYVNKNHVTATYDMAKEAVATGKAGMMISGEYAIKDIATKWPDADIGFFGVPYNDTDKIVSADISWSVVVMKNGKHVDEVKKWLDLWSQPKYQDLYFKENPGLPAAGDVDGGSLPPALQTAYDDYLKQGKSTIQMNDYFDLVGAGAWLGDALHPAYIEVLLGKKADDMIQDIDKSFQQMGREKGIPGF